MPFVYFNKRGKAIHGTTVKTAKRRDKRPDAKRHPVTGCRMDTVYGDWLVAANVLEQWRDTGWAILKSGDLRQIQAKSSTIAAALNQCPFTIQDGILRLSCNGPMTKFDTSMSAVLGGSSTMRMRDALRQARALKAEGKVHAAFIDIDSPGGTLEGTAELAAAIRKTAKVMPVYVHAEDTAASAALWVATQASRFTCGPAAQVGSLGVKAQLVDASRVGQKGSVKPIVLDSGKFKSIGDPGRKITSEQRAEMQRRVDSFANVFRAEVQTARNMTKAQIEDAATARVYIGKEAVKVGLCDAVCTTDEALDYARAHMNDNPQPAKRGPGEGKPTPAANTGSPIMDWTEAQLSELQALAGDNTVVTADNADRVSYRLSKNLAKRNKALKLELEQVKKTKGKDSNTSAMDPELLRVRCEAAVERVQLLMEKRGLTAAAAKNLFSAFLSGGSIDPKTGKLSADAQPIEAFFTKAEDGNYPYQRVLTAFEEGKPADLNKNVTGHQPAPRDVPGEGGQDKPFAFDNVGTPVTLAAANKMRTDNGLPGYTVDQFHAVFPEAKVA